MAAVGLAHCLGDYLGDWMVRKVSDKERLEELINRKPNRWGNLTIYEFERDIKILQEQAERVHKLEQQNKRYREALKEISQKRMTYTDMAGVLLIARKALEGEE